MQEGFPCPILAYMRHDSVVIKKCDRIASTYGKFHFPAGIASAGKIVPGRTFPAVCCPGNIIRAYDSPIRGDHFILDNRKSARIGFKKFLVIDLGKWFAGAAAP